MTSKDMGKVVVEQQYYAQMNDTGDGQDDAKKWFFFFFYFTYSSNQLCKRVSGHDRRTLLYWGGDNTRPAVPHSIHKTTLAIKSWAQGMCNMSPASRHTVPVGTQ